MNACAKEGSPMLTMGIDIGSTACKAVILRDGETLLAKAVVPLGTGTAGAERVYRETLSLCGARSGDIARICATGYGRNNFPLAESQMSEISCHARGIHFLLPSARTVIDIGGQDVKVIRVNERGAPESFLMNDKCAAGTGRFLDVMAGVLDVKTPELGELSSRAAGIVTISNTCTVFAESEVISKLSTGAAIPDLVAGIHASVAKRVASLALRNGIVTDVAMSGGVALNQGVVSALQKELRVAILTHPDSQIAGALGAALFARTETVRQ